MKAFQVIRQTVLFAVILVSFSSCLGSIKGSGPSVQQTRNLPEITGVDNNFAGEIYIQQGENQEVIIEGQENILEVFQTGVGAEGTLKFSFSENVRNHKTIKVYITVIDIKKVKISGSGKVKGTNAWNIEDCDIDISGSGYFESEMNARNVAVKISGSGDANFIGEAESMNFTLSGSGSLDALYMPVQDCKVKISGSGDAKVYVEKTLNVSVSGSGSVSYRGNPTITKSVSGSGNIENIN